MKTATDQSPNNNNLKTLPAVIKRLLMAEAVGAIALSCAPMAHANPTGGEVAAGAAEIVQQGARMDINQASQRAVINWQVFSIDNGEHVNFSQPGRDSATLNRVAGNDPSAILGRLTANGSVYLVNRNGIMVGQDAEIDVGSLTATTANISNKDFMEGRMNFAEPGNPDARIINHGNITVQQGGLVALVAPGVENHGTINARLGKIALAGGDAFTLDLYGDQLINLTVTKEQLAQISSADGNPLSHYVSNTGEIIADGGMVTILAGTGKAIVDSLINLKGHVQAQTVENRNGVITLLGDENTQVEVAGTLDASGQTAQAQGGRVEVRGGEVQLAEGSRIDVSGNGQGGTALVGGDFQGSGEGIRARTTTVERNAMINADSHSAGDGGKVIVWADDHTHFDGAISARGGQSSGNGGLVEVSGKHTLHYDGDVDASAKHGKAGELLLDPGNLIVKTMTVEENKTAAKPDANGSVTATSTDAAVNVQKVNALLQGGTSVSLKADNDLTVAAKIDGRQAIDGKAGASVSLAAGHDVNINDHIFTNNGDILIKASTGDITMANDTILSAGNRNITLSAGGGADLQHLLTTGKIAVASGANATFKQALTGLDNQGIGEFAVDAGGNVVLNGLLSNSAAAVSADGLIDVVKPVFTAGDVNLTGQTLIVESGAGISTKGASGNMAGKALNLTSAGGMTVKGNLLTGNAAINLQAQNGSLTTAGDIAIDSGSAGLALKAGGDISLGSLCLISGECGGKTAAQTTAAAAITSENGNITLNGNLLADRSLLLTANNGALTLGGINLSTRTGASVQAQSKQGIKLNNDILTHNGGIAIQSTNGAITAADDIAIDSGSAGLALKAGGDISLGSLCLISGECGGKAAAQTAAAAAITSENSNITLAGNLLADRSLLLTANNGALTLGGIDLSSRQGATLQAQGKQGIKLNNDILTKNGDIAISSTDGAITMADNKILSAGNRNITLTAGSGADLQHLMTTGKIAVTSGGNATFGKTLTGLNNQGIGEFTVDAGGNVVLNGLLSNSAITVSADGLVDIVKPVFTAGDVNLTGKTLTVESDADINTKGLSGNVTGKALNLTASGDMTVKGNLLTGNAAINLQALNGSMTTAGDIAIDSGSAGLALKAGGNVSLGSLCLSSGECGSKAAAQTTAAAVITSENGNITLTGNLLADRSLLLTANNGALTLGGIDLSSRQGATLQAQSKNAIKLNSDILTKNGSIAISSTDGAIIMAKDNNIAIDSGSAELALKADGDISLGSLCLISGKCGGTTPEKTSKVANITSENGNITLAGDLLADRSLVLQANNGALTLGGIDLRSRQGVTLQAQSQQGINLNNDILTNNGEIAIGSMNGAITMAGNKILSAGNRNITLAAGGGADLQHLMTTGKTTVTSGANATFGQTLTGLNNQGIGEFIVDAGGNVVLNGLRSNSAVTVSADGLVDVVKPVFTAGDVNLVGKTLTVESGAGISTKGANGNVAGKALNLTSTGDMIVKGNLLTGNTAINLQALNGSLTTAGDIAIDSGSAGLALKAGGDISLGSLCLVSGGCDGKADAQTAAAAVVTSENGSITLAGNLLADRSLLLTANNGALTLGGIDLSSRQGATLQAQSEQDIKLNNDILTKNGDIAIQSINGAITMADNTILSAGNQNISLEASGDVHAQHLISTNKIDVTSGADVSFEQALTGIQKQGIGDLIVNAAGDVTLNGAVSNGSLTVANADSISILKPIFAAGAVDFNSKSLNVASGADISTKGMDGKHSGSQLKLTTNGNMMLNANLMTGDAAIELKSTGMEGSITTADNISIDSGSAAVNIDADGDINMGITCLASGEVCSKDSGAEIGIENPAMATIISQNGDININGSLIADRSLSITASQGKLGLGTIDLSLRELAELQLSANGAIVLNGDVLTENGMLTVSDAGSITGTVDKRLQTGTADISLKSEGDVSLYDVFTTGKLDLVSDGSIIFNEALGADDVYNGLAALEIQGKSSITFKDQVHLTGVHPVNNNYDESYDVLNVQQTGTSGKLTINGKIVVDNGSVYLGKPVGTDSFTDDNNIELGNSIYALNGTTITLNNDVHVNEPKLTKSEEKKSEKVELKTLNVNIPPELIGYELQRVQDEDGQLVNVLDNRTGAIAVNGNITGLFEPASPLNIAFAYKSSVSLPKWQAIPENHFVNEEAGKEYTIFDGEFTGHDYPDKDGHEFSVHWIGSAAFDFNEISKPDNAFKPQKAIMPDNIKPAFFSIMLKSIGPTPTPQAASTPAPTTDPFEGFRQATFTVSEFNSLNDFVVTKANSESLSSLDLVEGHSIAVKSLESNTVNTRLPENSVDPSVPDRISISPAIKQASEYTKTLETVQVDGHSITVKPTEESTTKITLSKNSASTPEQVKIFHTESTLDGLKTLDVDVPKTNALDPDQTDTSSSTKQTLNYANSLEEGPDSADHSENEESVILGGGSEADNTDLGLNSPETGAVQDTYSTKHSPVCSVNKTNGKSKAGLPHCGNSSLSKS